MSKRSDIIEPYEWGPTTKTGLVYSEILGWIDLGHAQGNDINALVANISEGQKGYQDFYTVSYGQNMRAYQRKMGTGKFVRWRIKKGLSLTEIHSVALAMMFSCAGIFENYQARWFFSWYTDSGFSGEDLTSDLLGFYRAILPMNYPSRLKLVSKESALRRWDHYGPIGKYKNKGFLPLLFPDPELQCVPNEPIKGKLPSFLTLIEPYTDFSSDKVKVLTDDGTYFSFLGRVGS